MISANDLRVATIMAEVAENLDETASSDEVLHRITKAAVDTIPGVEFASVTVRYRDGHLETFAPTDAITLRADRLQYELREGPCYDAASSEEAASSTDIATDSRWPTYGPAAAALGLRSQLAVRFYEDAKSRGALNLYSPVEGLLTDQLPLARLFARHAAVAMGHTSTVAGLHQALASRKVIGQAIGMVMERYSIDEERAFEFLMRVSQTGNIKLRDVAAEAVRQGNLAAAED
jgi:ANTAR domain/GAF domain